MTDLPIPESLDTLAAQFELMAAGVKPAVLVPHWSPQWSVPEGYAMHRTPVGTFFHHPDRVRAAAIDAAVEADEIGYLLGYGVGRKPLHPTATLMLANAVGQEVVAVLVDRGTEKHVRAALEAMRRARQTIIAQAALTVVRARLAAWTRYFEKYPEDPKHA